MNPKLISRRNILLAFLWLVFSPFQASAMDLTKASVVFPPNLSGPERKAVTMLIEEVEKRTQVHWSSSSAWPSGEAPVIAVGPAALLQAFAGNYAEELKADTGASGAEGYRIRIKKGRGTPAVFVIGNDARGVLFGVGHLLRVLHMKPREIMLADDFNVATKPRYPLRGHQLGYRPKTNSYDAWDLDVWEQYIRDLVVFGANAIELIPPRSDDAADSPHFPRPPMEMMIGMSRLAAEYGIDVWIWYPAMDQDYSDPKTVEFALNEWGQVFQKLPRIDAVFVPGGDPGHTQPKYLMALLEKQTHVLHRSHPQAQMWVSPQSFNQEWLDEFANILQREQPAWLSGVVFGPQIRVSLPQLRELVPSRYPIRHYPDITHSRQCQFPVPDWDTAFAVSEGRECINPRPLGQAAIFRLLQPGTIGFLTYSEGCNDDVNKTIWSALGWNPEAKVIDILREYSRYYVGEGYAEGFAQGLLALERNWQGPLLANESVYTTLAQFQAMEKAASPRDLKNWRFQQALYRAYYDGYLRRRLLHEGEAEERAMNRLREAQKSRRGLLVAISEAEDILDRAARERVATDWRARVFELAEALFQSISMQLSVERFKAISIDRGANLDAIDYPLNDRIWLKERFAVLRNDGADRWQGINEILEWANPGPGGFYDDLGNVARQPHLVRGQAFELDPAFLASPHTGFGEGRIVDEPDGKSLRALRKSWRDHASSMNDTPLTVRYNDLDPAARYTVRVVYGGDSPTRKIRLVANDGLEIHPLIAKPSPIRPVEFEIPQAATRSGQLTLNWFREPGLGGNGRGCQVSEIWLIKK
jgi:hypothetical protein